jgi:O-methyltransferase domain/Dimerisation domain
MRHTKQHTDNAGITPRKRLVRQITSCWRTQALHAAVQLDLPDQLASGLVDLPELARACQCDLDGLQRLLRALCVLQVCRLQRSGHYKLTAAGQALCRIPRDGLPSLRALSMWWGDAMWPMWGDLAYSVRTGQSARKRQSGLKNYEFLDKQPDAAGLFHEAMQAMTALINEEVAQLVTWRGASRLVDVGGGNGSLAAALAEAHNQLKVVVLDRPDAEPSADTPFGRLAQAGRASFIAGDFFDVIPPNADRYLLKSILHNWDDASCLKILAACAAAAGPGTPLLLVERIRPDRFKSTSQDEALVRADLNMLAGLGGRERSRNEFDDLLTRSGFEVISVSPTRHEFSVIEARRN